MNFTFTTAALLLLLATCARGFHFHTHTSRSRVGQSSTRAVQRPSGSLDGYLMRPANVQPSFTRRNRPLFSSLGSGAVLEKPKISTKKTTENSAKDSAGEWQVRLYNDPVNKREVRDERRETMDNFSAMYSNSYSVSPVRCSVSHGGVRRQRRRSFSDNDERSSEWCRGDRTV